MNTKKTKIEKILAIHQTKGINKIMIFLVMSCIIFFFLISSEITNLKIIYSGLPALFNILDEMFPPNFHNFKKWVLPAFDSITMSVSATVISGFFAFPIALLASKNLSNNRFVYFFMRGFLSVFRSIPEIILGLLIVVTVGFGIISGTLAITIHSIGMLGKFFSEAIERSNNNITEIIISNGTKKRQIIFFGILPQVYQEFIDLIMYRWEYNFRQSTILGIVGAGGIGFELLTSLRLMQYDQTAAILLIIIFLVTLIDIVSSRIRNYFRE